MAGNRKHGFRRGNNAARNGSQLSSLKSCIKNTAIGQGFDHCGNEPLFKRALSELRKEGMIIKYIEEKCHYVIQSKPNSPYFYSDGQIYKIAQSKWE